MTFNLNTHESLCRLGKSGDGPLAGSSGSSLRSKTVIYFLRKFHVRRLISYRSTLTTQENIQSQKVIRQTSTHVTLLTLPVRPFLKSIYLRTCLYQSLWDVVAPWLRR